MGGGGRSWPGRRDALLSSDCREVMHAVCQPPWVSLTQNWPYPCPLHRLQTQSLEKRCQKQAFRLQSTHGGPTQAVQYRVQSEKACREDTAGAVTSLRDEATPANRGNLGSSWPHQDTDLTHLVLPRPCQPLSFLSCCCSVYQTFSLGPPTSSEITTRRLIIT